MLAPVAVLGPYCSLHHCSDAEGRICCGSTEKVQHWLMWLCLWSSARGCCGCSAPQGSMGPPTPLGSARGSVLAPDALGELINVCLQGVHLGANSSFSLQMVANTNALSKPSFPLALSCPSLPCWFWLGLHQLYWLLGKAKDSNSQPFLLLPQVFALPMRLDGVCSIPGSLGQLCCVPWHPSLGSV